MKKHEKHCTLNPNRVCRMCDAADIPQQPTEELVEKFKEITDKQSLESFLDSPAAQENCEKLRDITQNCPACMLAVIRQCPEAIVDFDFRKESESFWRDINISNRDDCDDYRLVGQKEK